MGQHPEMQLHKGRASVLKLKRQDQVRVLKLKKERLKKVWFKEQNSSNHYLTSKSCSKVA